MHMRIRTLFTQCASVKYVIEMKLEPEIKLKLKKVETSIKCDTSVITKT